MKKIAFPILTALMMLSLACDKEDDGDGMTYEVNDPDSAPEVAVDRFSDDAAMLMRRSANPSLPDADEPIDFDSGAPFITMGFGPSGQVVEYYNFDVQSTDPAPIYVLFREGASSPVEGQLNVIDVIPGDAGYNDFWHVHRVTVPEDYEANTASSLADLQERGFEMEATDMLVNCPVVPKGSTAEKRLGGESNGLVRGWYKDEVVYYFNFSEKQLMPTSDDMVPLSPIYVTFNINPNEPDGGPSSGFMTEMGSSQTHNVLATVPSSSSYSPLWTVNVYHNSDFDMVMDFQTASSANVLAMGVATVNCPVVEVQ